METGKLNAEQRVLKLTADIIALVSKGRRDPVRTANMLQRIIDTPDPNFMAVMSKERYAEEKAGWTSFLRAHSFTGNEALLGSALIATLAKTYGKDFPLPLRMPVPNLCALCKSAVFWRRIPGISIVTPDAVMKGRSGATIGLYDDLKLAFNDDFAAVPAHLADAVMEELDAHFDTLCTRFGADRYEDDESAELMLVHDVFEQLHSTYFWAAVLYYRKGMAYEFDPFLDFYAEHGNYPLGFDDEGKLVMLCAE